MRHPYSQPQILHISTSKFCCCSTNHRHWASRRCRGEAKLCRVISLHHTPLGRSTEGEGAGWELNKNKTKENLILAPKGFFIFFWEGEGGLWGWSLPGLFSQMIAPPCIVQALSRGIILRRQPSPWTPQVLVLNTSDKIQLHPIWVCLKHLASHLVMSTKTPARKKDNEEWF